MNKERLLRLADFLEKEVPQQRFDMRYIFTNDVYSLEDLQHKCGTAACAMGWACVVPEFERDGLSFKRGYYAGRVHYGEYTDFSAISEFFDISSEHSRHLFEVVEVDEDGKEVYINDEEWINAERDNETPHDVAARIRAFVARHQDD